MKQHVDQKWRTGAGAPGQVAYDSHFFSGQDCYVFLYPYYADKLVPIPVTQFQYGTSQQKTPIYGAWSYHWDAVAKGQVIVQGEITIVYTMPNMLGQMIGDPKKSDYPRKGENGGVLPLLDNNKSLKATQRKDLRNEIWGASKSGEADPYLSGLNTGSINGESSAFPFGRKEDPEFAGHQPFDIIIAYGDNPSMHFEDNSKFEYSTWQKSVNEYTRMMATSQNEEGWSSSRRVRIESVELMSAGTVLEVSGQPLQETYSFIARDVTTPSVG
jgi:hypothetical protein